MVQVADDVTARMASIRAGLPVGYAIDLVRDDSSIIRTSVDGVKEHLALGALFWSRWWCFSFSCQRANRMGMQGRAVIGASEVRLP
jgi:hypothetical protein